MSSDAEFVVPQPQANETPSLPQGAQAAGQPQAAPWYQGAGAPQTQAPLPQQQQIILPKNPALGVILSFFIPGLGSIVNGSTGRGLTILGVYVVGWILTLFIIGIPILIGAWIWGLVDGYLSAQRWNAAHGIVS